MGIPKLWDTQKFAMLLSALQSPSQSPGNL